jgi:hypothetical protein
MSLAISTATQPINLRDTPRYKTDEWRLAKTQKLFLLTQKVDDLTKKYAATSQCAKIAPSDQELAQRAQQVKQKLQETVERLKRNQEYCKERVSERGYGLMMELVEKAMERSRARDFQRRIQNLLSTNPTERKEESKTEKDS